LADVIRRERPHLIHAHSPCLNALAAQRLGVPLVYELRSSWEDAAVSNGTTTEGSLRYRASRALESYVLRRADAITTICEGLRADVLGRGIAAERVTVVPNAVDPWALDGCAADERRAFRARFNLDRRSVLGFIGSFFAWEGLSLLLEALPAMQAQIPDLCVLLVGDGNEEMALREQARRLGIESSVCFAGRLPHAHVSAAYAATDVLVYPREHLRLTDMVTPLKPLEAMALGKLLVASDVGGHRELIRDGETGVLFQAGRPEALAAAVLRLFSDEALQARCRTSGPAYVRAERTWERVVPRYRGVYERVTAGMP
jgi:PEP-CTERM/exosortase A-associated glycosyltransferase